LVSRVLAGQDRDVTQQNRSALESALDVFVYAPVGLALTAIEELPNLAEKGRTQIQGQITIARMVGQFAVAQGRRQLDRRLGTNGRASSGEPSAPAGGTAGSQRAGAEVSRAVTNGTAARPASSAATDERLPEAQGQPLEAELIDSDGGYGKLSGRHDEADRSPGAATGVAGPAAAYSRSARSSDQLAIPGYDSLSASQVVQRLAGLSKDELEAVGAYESAHRARRTILTRVNQLKA
jgi:hypothetical protein